MFGTFLLLDKHNGLFEVDEVVREVNRPLRHRATPVITSGLAGHGCANFSNTIIKNADGYYGWYVAALDAATAQRYTAFVTSPNGATWSKPIVLPGTVGREFSDIIDEGIPGPERYKAFRKSYDLADLPPRWRAELLTSPDGLNWTARGNVTENEYGETWQPFRVGMQYGLLHRWNIKDFIWTDAQGVVRKNTTRDPFVRCIALTKSTDPKNFPPSTLLFAPDGGDSGETQFYAVSGIVRRGQYYVGFLHVLRDDLTAIGVTAGAYGTGYSVLIWSLDGVVWTRSREPFFSPAVGKWDGAITWIDSIVPAGNEVKLFYGGYKHGHKVFTDRQIGVVKVRTDRYVAVTGLLRTRPFINAAKSLHLNLDGTVRVRVLDESNYVLHGGNWITANTISRSAGIDLAPYKGRAIKLEFQGGKLYSFKLS